MKRILLMTVALTATISMFAQDVAYLDADGKTQTLSGGGYETISSQNTFTNGWYVLDNSVTIDSRVTVSGTVHLVLKDGCTLTLPKGIHLKEDNSLTIYGQTNGTGKLTAGPSDDYLAGIGGDNHERAGTLVVNGGNVEATAGFSAAGIGGGAQGYWKGDYGHGGIVLINGGTVYAKGNQYGAGIGGGGNHRYVNTAIPGEGGSVTINGGNVTAIGGDDGGYGIGPGRSSGNEGKAGTLSISWRNKSDRIYMSSVNATITLNSDFVYEDTKEAVSADNLGDRAIIPPASPEPTPKKWKGDVNKDGNVDISDIVAVINQIAGTSDYARADVNGDLNADISDIVAIINIIANGVLEPEDDTDPAVKAGLCPDENHPHAIDLGGDVKYACCNVGASAPWEFGGYYAWGETETKSMYVWNNYKYGTKYGEPCDDIGHDIAGTQYDVAHVLWGGKWQMPNAGQLEYLCETCSSKWVTLNGIKGVKYTGSNGGSIFLPATGDMGYDGTPYEVGEEGKYGSSEIPWSEDNTSDNINYLSLKYNDAGYWWSRIRGLSIRPVNVFKY